MSLGLTSPLERSYAVVEQAIGRPLREAERAVDVLKLDAALNEAKDELDAAISDEMLRATRAWVRRGKHGLPLLEITKAMRRPLEQLHELGRIEAIAELERLGYIGIREPKRAFAAPDPFPGAGMEGLENTMRQGLLGVSLRIEDELVALDLGGASSQAIAHALMNVPGARDLASRVVSTALTSGLALTFEENADLVPCWEYSSVLDSGTCDRCRPLDGKEYHSLEELFVDLPRFGPNPSCRGGGRCRCRAVPCPPRSSA